MKVGAAVVLADQPVPNCFAWASHTHGQGSAGHCCGGGRVLVQNRLVATHAGKVIDIARFGQTHDWVDQTGWLVLLSRRGMSALGARGAAGCVSGRQQPCASPSCGNRRAIRLACRDGRGNHNAQAAGCRSRTAKIDLAGLVVQIVHRRVRIIISAKDLFGFDGFVRLPTIGDGHGARGSRLLGRAGRCPDRSQRVRRNLRTRPA